MPDVYLLTYNPEKWDWVDRDEFLEAVANGEAISGRWSTGQKTDGIGPGDEVYLLRQGHEPRGIIAYGTVGTEVQQGAHWDDHGGFANYVEVAWSEAVPADAPLPLAQLKAAAPDQHWHPQGSGSKLRAECVSAVEDAWASHVAS